MYYTDGDDIVTEVNVSYAAGNKSPTQQQQQQFAVPTPSTRPLHKTAHSSCSNSQQKPTIKPRKSIPARQRESEICNGKSISELHTDKDIYIYTL